MQDNWTRIFAILSSALGAIIILMLTWVKSDLDDVKKMVITSGNSITANSTRMSDLDYRMKRLELDYRGWKKRWGPDED